MPQGDRSSYSCQVGAGEGSELWLQFENCAEPQQGCELSGTCRWTTATRRIRVLCIRCGGTKQKGKTLAEQTVHWAACRPLYTGSVIQLGSLLPDTNHTHQTIFPPAGETCHRALYLPEPRPIWLSSSPWARPITPVSCLKAVTWVPGSPLPQGASVSGGTKPKPVCPRSMHFSTQPRLSTPSTGWRATAVLNKRQGRRHVEGEASLPDLLKPLSVFPRLMLPSVEEQQGWTMPSSPPASALLTAAKGGRARVTGEVPWRQDQCSWASGVIEWWGNAGPWDPGREPLPSCFPHPQEGSRAGECPALDLKEERDLGQSLRWTRWGKPGRPSRTGERSALGEGGP